MVAMRPECLLLPRRRHRKRGHLMSSVYGQVTLRPLLPIRRGDMVHTLQYLLRPPRRPQAHAPRSADLVHLSQSRPPLHRRPRTRCTMLLLVSPRPTPPLLPPDPDGSQPSTQTQPLPSFADPPQPPLTDLPTPSPAPRQPAEPLPVEQDQQACTAARPHPPRPPTRCLTPLASEPRPSPLRGPNNNSRRLSSSLSPAQS